MNKFWDDPQPSCSNGGQQHHMLSQHWTLKADQPRSTVSAMSEDQNGNLPLKESDSNERKSEFFKTTNKGKGGRYGSHGSSKEQLLSLMLRSNSYAAGEIPEDEEIIRTGDIPDYPARGKCKDLFSYNYDLSDFMPNEDFDFYPVDLSLDLRDMLNRLLTDQLVSYPSLWPELNFPLSQIHEWPIRMRTYSTWQMETTIQSNDRNESSFNDHSLHNQISNCNPSRQSAASNDHVSCYNPWSGLTTFNDLSSLSHFSTMNNIWSQGPMNGSIDLRFQANAPCHMQNDVKVSSMYLNGNVRHNNSEEVIRVGDNRNLTVGANHFYSDTVSHTDDNHNMYMPFDSVTDQVSQESGSQCGKKTENINRMADEIFKSGNNERRIPKREEDIKTLKHFRSLKEKGKSGKTFQQSSGRMNR